MHLHRFIVSVPLEGREIQLKDYAVTHQMRDVLRLGLGEEVVLVDGKGQEAVCVIDEYLAKDTMRLLIVKKQENKNESERSVILYCAVLKRDNFEWVVQKATEVGVAIIVPMVSEHTVKLGLNHDRLLRIAKEAAEQSGRVVVPEIGEPVPFVEALAQLASNQTEVIFLDFSDTQFTAADVQEKKSVALFVGPEGGWSAREQEAAKLAGCVFRSLGKLTLRAETAATVASYIAVNG